MPRRTIGLSGLAALAAAACTPRAAGSCIPSGPASAVQAVLHNGGQGTVASLCPGAVISITDAGVSFTAPDQEISTQGYPTDDTRATFFIEALPSESIEMGLRGRRDELALLRMISVNAACRLVAPVPRG